LSARVGPGTRAVRTTVGGASSIGVRHERLAVASVHDEDCTYHVGQDYEDVRSSLHVVASSAVRRPFGTVVRDLLIEKGMTTGLGHANWRGFASSLDGVSYETLRKAATGERWPGVKVMESVAAALEVPPSTFWEWRLAQAQQAFDPGEVGIEEANANLELWEAAIKQSRS
jgi:hypothetical protein